MLKQSAFLVLACLLLAGRLHAATLWCKPAAGTDKKLFAIENDAVADTFWLYADGARGGPARKVFESDTTRTWLSIATSSGSIDFMILDRASGDFIWAAGTMFLYPAGNAPRLSSRRGHCSLGKPS